ncbi:MAG TPA: hypothetical protein DD638_03595 [Pasteurellaceae bacterium]|nr:hypothetical protein [Pasteurellaceae bacterium]
MKRIILLVVSVLILSGCTGLFGADSDYYAEVPDEYLKNEQGQYINEKGHVVTEANKVVNPYYVEFLKKWQPTDGTPNPSLPKVIKPKGGANNTQIQGNNLVERLCNAPVINAPEAKGLKDGENTIPVGNGLMIKFDVKNGKAGDEIKIYYPNGQLETHTKFKQGKADGWSTGYSPEGKVRTRFFYQKGKVTEYEIYSSDGTLQKKDKLICS